MRIPGLALDSPSEDLFPPDEDVQRLVLAWANMAFNDADGARKELAERWMTWYKMYRSWAGKRKPGEWQSRVWIPLAFYIVETITPRLMAQLPKITVAPVGPEDSAGAKQMEYLLDYVCEQNDVYLEMVAAFKSALIYGTGILKTLYDEKYAYSLSREEVMQPQTMMVDMGQLDVDGNPMQQEVTVGEAPTGQFETVRQPVLKYAGPAAEAVDIFDFFVSPEATSMDDASYVIHRVFRTRDQLEKMASMGVYHIPPDLDWESLTSDARSGSDRLSEINLGGGSFPQTAPGTKLIEVREFWTPEVILTTAGDSLLLRAERNPYAHGEIPFVRIVDQLVPHEFWGIGELEPLEGVQDVTNALWNTRIDNVKLVLNRMFAVSVDYMVDMGDLQIRPGGAIRVKEGMPLDQVLKPIDLGEVTSSSYTEAAEMERLSEKVSGVSAYQMGTDSPALNRTATGVALISEQGNTRFAHKVRISELTGLRRLAKHFGTILQQFMPPGMFVRILGPEGQWLFQTIDPQSIAGAFDYNIEAESATQTESVRREQTLNLFELLAQFPQVNVYRLIEDVLRTFGRKDVQEYILGPKQMLLMQQLQQMAALPPGTMPPPEGAMNAQQPPVGQSVGPPGGGPAAGGPPPQA